MKILALFLIAFAGLCADAQTQAAPTQEQAAPSKTVHQLFLDDQEDIGNVNSDRSAKEYDAHLKVRMAEVRAKLAGGELKTGQDFEDASFIFQHGNTADDCLLAHVLAMGAVIHGDDAARWIEAATLDRYLQLIGQPQVFGTQYPLDPNLPHAVAGPHAPFRTGRTLAPYNEQFLPDSVRLDFCVPALAQQKQNVALFNVGKRPRGTMRAPNCQE